LNQYRDCDYDCDYVRSRWARSGEVHVAGGYHIVGSPAGGYLRRNRVSLGDNGSHGENGLLHLIHIGRELEHRGDQGAIGGTRQFLQGLVSGLYLIQLQQKERKGKVNHNTSQRQTYYVLTILWVTAISRGVPWARSPSVKE